VVPGRSVALARTPGHRRALSGPAPPSRTGSRPRLPSGGPRTRGDSSKRHTCTSTSRCRRRVGGREHPARSHQRTACAVVARGVGVLPGPDGPAISIRHDDCVRTGLGSAEHTSNRPRLQGSRDDMAFARSDPAASRPRRTGGPQALGGRGFGVGKTSCGAVSEIRPLRTEESLSEAGRPVDDIEGGGKRTTRSRWTSADHAQDNLVLYLFGTRPDRSGSCGRVGARGAGGWCSPTPTP